MLKFAQINSPRFLLPIAIVITVLFFLQLQLYIDQKYQQQRATQVYELQNSAHNYQSEINAYRYVLDEMESFVVKTPQVSTHKFSQIARDIIERNEVIRGIQLARDSVISHVYPVTGNEQSLGHELLKDKRHAFDTQSVIQNNSIKLSGPFDLIQGGQGVIIRKAIYITDPERFQETYWGLAIVVLDWQKLHQKLRASEGNISAIRAFHDGTWQHAFYGQDSVFSTGVTSEFNILNTRWQLAIQADDEDLNSLQQPIFISLLSLLLIVLLGYHFRKKFQWILPLSGILLVVFLAAVIISISYKRIKHENHQQLLVQTQAYHNQIQQRLSANLDYMRLLSASRQQGSLTKAEFQEKVSLYVKEHPELINITWINSAFYIEDAAPIQGNEQIIGLKIDLDEPKRASRLAKETHYPVYTKAFMALQGGASFEVWLPIYHADKFLGLFTGVYSIPELLNTITEDKDLNTFGLSLVSRDQGVIDRHLVDSRRGVEFERQLSLSPPGQGISLKVVKYKTQLWSIEVVILAFIALLCALSIVIALFLLLRARIELQNKYAELNETNAALFYEKERSLITLNSIGEGIITLAMDATVKSINPIAQRLLQQSAQQVIGQPLVDVLNLLDAHTQSKKTQLLRASIAKVIEHKSPVSISGVVVQDKEYNLRCTFAAIMDQQQQVVGIVIVLHDTTDMYAMTRELEYEATHDSLTGLTNRREFDRRLKHCVLNAQEEDSSHALLYIDLDQFKLVNDTCGHVAGDELLKQISRLIESRVASGHLIARLGGDEFALILYNCPQQKAYSIAEDIRYSIEQFRFIWDQKNFTLGVSIGLVVIDQRIQNHEQLLSWADIACYIAKDKGRNQVHLYVEDDNESHRRHNEMHWVAQINHALESNAFVLYRQPLQKLADSQEKDHYEVLIRMRDSEGNIVNPGAFLPAAERYGMMLAVDRWVITNTVQFFQDNPDKLTNLELCSIHLSAHSLVNKELLSFLERLLRDKHELCHKLCFEITETAVVSNLIQANDFIKKLKSFGCKMALDDFGSGMASFGYLKDLDVDILKIDGSFVRNCADDLIDLAIVESIHDIAQVMNMQTVAEWAEDANTVSVLQKIGVDYVQGYAIGKPVPLVELAAK